MAPFEELQQLWQHQPARGFTGRDAADLASAFRRYGRRNDRVGVAKIVLIASQLILLVSVFSHRPLTLFGACLVDFSALYFMLCDWRKQRAIARMDFASPSVAFIQDAISRLKAQRHPFGTREFKIALAGFWTGCAIMVASRWTKMEYPGNLTFLATLLIAPCLAFVLGRWIRAKRFQHEGQPLIERLERVLATMQEPIDSDRK